ncbi:hypothetical protein GBA52_000094 [Prunus armeniaca]|nr:hypothetical protein GBA52_000094 [Prunus armeniaca]
MLNQQSLKAGCRERESSLYLRRAGVCGSGTLGQDSARPIKMRGSARLSFSAFWSYQASDLFHGLNGSRKVA